jgi:hypothetical protein
MTRRALDPRICNIACDANAVDRDGTSRDSLVERLVGLSAAGTLNLVVAGGVRQEVLHPHTPDEVKEIVLPQIYNLRPGLVAAQRTDRDRVLKILQGNAMPGKHDADASHLSEAAETGCAYFITHDSRILGKRTELHSVLPPSLTIVTIGGFLEIYDDYEAGRRI